MTHRSDRPLLILHAVRLLGFADSAAVADRAGAGPDETVRLLHDAERAGLVQHVAFADLDGWSLTDAGKASNERHLAAERAAADPGGTVAAAYRDFRPLNARLLRAVTDWQIRPTDDDPLAPNAHTDRDWDARVLDELTALGAALVPLNQRLAAVLARFDGYAPRFEYALGQARRGHTGWVDRTDVDSCHRVWFQLHEDLVATLGIDRGTEV